MNWVTGIFASARDEIRFRLHDRRTRREEAAQAAIAFPTAHLETELEIARERLAAELEHRFDAPMRTNRVSLAALQAEVAALDAEHETLVRNHHGELKAAYADAEQLKTRLASAKRAVSNAYEEHKAAKGGISSWHNRARSRIPIYGKRGKPIPDRSPFFFSHSDLDSAKRDADRASSQIDSAKRARDRIFTEVRRCGEVIDELKESRERRRELLAAGRTASKVLSDRASLQPEIARLSGAEGRMQRLRDAWVAGGAVAMEIASIRDGIAEALASQKMRLLAFDGDAARAARRDSFIQRVVSTDAE